MEKNYYKNYFRLEKEHWLFKIRRKIFLYFIKKHTKSTSRVFDFGCGSGYMVRELQKIGYDAYGVDFEEEAINYGLSSGIKNLKVGTGNKIDHTDESFDLVTAFDVLEHLDNEQPTVRELTRILKPGGRIIISVPAYDWLWGIQDEVSHHFRRYTVKSLSRVFKEPRELKIVEKTYFNTFLFLPIAVVRLISKWFNIYNRESDFELGGRVLNAIFYFIFNLEFYFLKFMSFPFGVSILFILEKNDNRNK